MTAHPIRQFREQAGKSQEELAGLLGVTKATVSRWETGERFPEREFWPAIREITGVTADDLAAAVKKATA